VSYHQSGRLVLSCLQATPYREHIPTYKDCSNYCLCIHICIAQNDDLTTVLILEMIARSSDCFIKLHSLMMEE